MGPEGGSPWNLGPTVEIYHDDAVLEFPQSGERFEGVANILEWRLQYPADVSYRIRRITAREDLVVVEVSVRYNGGPWQSEVQLLEFRGDKVVLELLASRSVESLTEEVATRRSIRTPW